jgi:hypothetical protein
MSCFDIEKLDTCVRAKRLGSMATDGSQMFLVRCANSMVLRRCLDAYLFLVKRIWTHLPTFLRGLPLGRVYGRHLHGLVRLLAKRQQSFATFFLRNRAELELMRRLLEQEAHGSNLDVSVLGCSKLPFACGVGELLVGVGHGGCPNLIGSPPASWEAGYDRAL